MGAAWLVLLLTPLSAQQFDLVVRGGRVLDPESGLDAVRNLGISSGKVAALSAAPVDGRAIIDASGLVVAPGFIDLHSHGQDAENYRYKAMDGVTTALEMEVGVADMSARTLLLRAPARNPLRDWSDCLRERRGHLPIACLRREPRESATGKFASFRDVFAIDV